MSFSKEFFMDLREREESTLDYADNYWSAKTPQRVNFWGRKITEEEEEEIVEKKKEPVFFEVGFHSDKGNWNKLKGFFTMQKAKEFENEMRKKYKKHRLGKELLTVRSFC